jgi:hypothetical protein
MDEEHTTFKVTDRRPFNPDGSPREISGAEKDQAEASGSETIIGVSPQTDSANASTATATSRSDTEQEQGPESELPDEDPASFLNFMMSIASNAASSLGMMEHPVTHKREVDLELAKHWIDVIAMLQQKTRGNLGQQEEQLIEGLLGDLRMQYVSLANSAAPKSAGSYTGRDVTGAK